MHGHASEAEFIEGICGLLAGYYLTVALMNAVAAFYQWAAGRARSLFRVPLWGLRFSTVHLWLLVALAFTIPGTVSLVRWAAAPAGGAAALHLAQETRESLDRWSAPAAGLLSLPGEVRTFLNRSLGPLVFCSVALLALVLLYALRRFFAKPIVAWTMLNLALLVMGLSLTDPNFARIVTRPDNVAIVSMVFLLGFFTWVSAYNAVRNDEWIARGEETLEKRLSEKVLVWPDLVYIELICMVALTALLIVWAIVLKAPLEEPANSVSTPNPSKAPWYFVGLQEMLYYFDPWMAGVVLPSLIIFGLMAVPYLDRNPQGNGYYTINERKFAYVTFQFGFLLLWITLILLGTFMRGPNWTFFGFYETWDVHKVDPQINVNLSTFFWVDWLGVGYPEAPPGAGAWGALPAVLLRESPGILGLVVYFAGSPLAMAAGSRFFGRMCQQMGFWRYSVMAMLLLIMLLLPVKMIAKWTVHLQYFVAMPEYAFYF